MLQIGKILKSNGVDGGLLVGFKDVFIEEIQVEEPVYIYFDGLPVPFFIQDITPKGNDKAIIHLNDISSLKDSEEVVGRGIFLDCEEEDPEAEGFVGWSVFNYGTRIGEVTGIEPIPGNLCIYVDDKMIPLHEDFVISADDKKKELRLELPEGILDL